MEKSIRKSAITRKEPTPPATERISTTLGTAGTWPASTCRSGSEIVTINPSKKATKIMMARFRLPVRLDPTRSPMGVMEISAPRVKNIIPARISTAPIRKHKRILGETGAIEKHSASTIQIMGRTAWRASCHFLINFFRIPKTSPKSFPVIIAYPSVRQSNTKIF